MIPKPALRKLIYRYLKDAKALFVSRRYASCVYICGYAIELSLKYRICNTFQFNEGYPETSQDFALYTSRLGGIELPPVIANVNHLKIHDLGRLLLYSGEEYFITNNFSVAWSTVSEWNVALRYHSGIVTRLQARAFFDAMRLLVKVIF